MPVVKSLMGWDIVLPRPELVNIYEADIGEGCVIGAFVEIGRAKIGKNCRIMPMTFIPEGVTIKDNVFIGPNVTFLNDKYAPTRGKWRGDPGTVVHSDVAIGGGAVIFPGIVIGKGARIGAGAVVNKDVEPGRQVVGVPARDVGVRVNRP
jgi:acetyltransferase-like isoleucine patch superfamily enzyme